MKSLDDLRKSLLYFGVWIFLIVLFGSIYCSAKVKEYQQFSDGYQYEFLMK